MGASLLLICIKRLFFNSVNMSVSYERKLFSFCSGRYEDQYILKFYKDKLHSMPCQNQASDSFVPFTNYSKRQYLANVSDTPEYIDLQSTASIAIAKCPKYALPRSTFLALWLLSHINIKHPLDVAFDSCILDCSTSNSLSSLINVPHIAMKSHVC